MATLTLTQLQAFKASINGDATAAAMVSAGNTGQVADYYNTVPASPTLVWRPVVPVPELNAVVDWSVFAGSATTVAKQNTWFAMTQPGSVDATAVGIRNGFNTVFGAGATLTALTNVGRRNGTRFEVLFSAPTSPASGANVSTQFGVFCSEAEVLAALAT